MRTRKWWSLLPSIQLQMVPSIGLPQLSLPRVNITSIQWNSGHDLHHIPSRKMKQQPVPMTFYCSPIKVLIILEMKFTGNSKCQPSLWLLKESWIWTSRSWTWGKMCGVPVSGDSCNILVWELGYIEWAPMQFINLRNGQASMVFLSNVNIHSIEYQNIADAKNLRQKKIKIWDKNRLVCICGKRQKDNITGHRILVSSDKGSQNLKCLSISLPTAAAWPPRFSQHSHFRSPAQKLSLHLRTLDSYLIHMPSMRVPNLIPFSALEINYQADSWNDLRMSRIIFNCLSTGNRTIKFWLDAALEFH